MSYDYLNEAFKKLDILEESMFDTSLKGMNELASFLDNDDDGTVVPVIDGDAESEEDLTTKSYIGNIIVNCNVCHSHIFRNKDEIDIDEEGNVNKEDVCPYCGESEGFVIVGEIIPFESKDTSEKVETDVVTESFDPRSGIIPKLTDAETSKLDNYWEKWSKQGKTDLFGASKFIARTYNQASKDEVASILAYLIVNGKIQLTASEGKAPEELNEIFGFGKPKKNLYIGVKYIPKLADRDLNIITDNIEEILVEEGFGNNTIAIREKDKQSEDGTFSSFIVEVTDTQFKTITTKLKTTNKLFAGLLHSQAVICHQNLQNLLEFQDRGPVNPKMRSVSESSSRATKLAMNEDFKEVSIKTDDHIMQMTSEENGKVTVTTEPIQPQVQEEQKLTVAPVSAELEDELLTPVEEEPSEKTTDTEAGIVTDEEGDSSETIDSEDVVIDEVDDTSIDELGEGYLRKVYENVKSFKTTDVSANATTLFVEGIIRFNSGAQKKTKFVFEAVDTNAKGQVRFRGSNKHLTESTDAFSLVGKVDNKKLFVESLKYKYNVKENFVRGIVRRK